MKHKFLTISLTFITPLFILLLVVGNCYAETFYVVNSQSRTLSRIDTTLLTVDNSFAALGNVPNKIVIDGDYIWCVNSGDNAVQKISRATGASLGNIFVGMGSNPWDAVKHQNYLYVTGLMTGKVYRVDTISGQVTGSVNVGTAPEALTVINNRLYVANAGDYTQNYAGSSISVIDLDSFSIIDTIPVHANPQYMASKDGLLHVSCTGNWSNIGGAVCIINTETNTVVNTIDIGSTPGCLWIANQDTAYVADSNGISLFSYNPQTFETIHDADNPISNGGSEIVGNNSIVAVLQPAWGGNGTVKILHPDLSLWQQYTVALMPTDLKMFTNPTATDDEYLLKPEVTVYPNPVKQGSYLNLKAGSMFKGKAEIFNIKGQKVASYQLNDAQKTSVIISLPCGIYCYKVIEANKQNASASGKLVILK